MIRLWLILVLAPVAYTATPSVPCNCNPVGINDSRTFKSNQMTSSGEIYSHLDATHARFNDRYAWCPRRNNGSGCECPQKCRCNPAPCHGSDPFSKRGHRCHTLPNCILPNYCQRLIYREWLQVDLRRVKLICGVATQGKKGVSDWAAYYKVKLSIDGKEWHFYRENGTQKIFKGNADDNSVVRHFFQSPVRARFVRFYPQRRKTKLSCMRVEVFVGKERLLQADTIYRDAFRGGILKLQCRVRGKKPSVTWRKNDKPLAINDDVLYETIVLGDLMSASLVVPYVTYQHEGVYSCLAKDSPCSSITRKHTFDVMVYMKNKDRMILVGGYRPVQKKVHIGKKLILNCTARFRERPLNRHGLREDPIPLVTWVKDLRLVNESRARKNVTVNGATITSSLVISPVKCHDEGVYRCIMINYRYPRQWLEKKFHVNVLKQKLVNKKEPLKVHKNIWTGAALRIQCTAQRNPAPNMSWFKDGEPVIKGRARVIAAVNGDKAISTLVINNVTCEDSGRYHCLNEGTQHCPVIGKKFLVKVVKRDYGVRCQTKSKPKQKETRKDWERSWLKSYGGHSGYDFRSFCQFLEWSTKYSCSQNPFS